MSLRRAVLLLALAALALADSSLHQAARAGDLAGVREALADTHVDALESRSTALHLAARGGAPGSGVAARGRSPTHGNHPVQATTRL